MDYYLPDTDIASVARNGKDVFLYAQAMYGELVECQGLLQDSSGLYVYRRRSDIVSRYERKQVIPGAPKLFTPLAAAILGESRYVFYVDDDNYIRDLRRGPDTDGDWVPGKLRSDLGLKAAPYSKLAAITMTNRWGTTLSIYYQADDKDASIKSANFKQGQSNWGTDTTRVTDPPLFGTSLSAVKAREGLQLDKQKPFNVDSSLPVVYLQWHSLEMAHAQGSDVRRMEDLGLKFAPHTSLTAIDDRGSLQYFYTSSENNNIKRVIVGNDSKTLQFDTLATPTPRSAITAVLVKPGKVVLFYQALERVTGKILIVALTLSESGGVWDGKPDRPAPEVTELR